MRFFSRVVFICNVCFIIAVILRFVELSRRVKGDLDSAIPFQPLESTLVIMGYGAIILNSLFFLFTVYWVLIKKIKLIPRWVVIFNLLILPLQVYYHFFFIN